MLDSLLVFENKPPWCWLHIRMMTSQKTDNIFHGRTESWVICKVLWDSCRTSSGIWSTFFRLVVTWLTERTRLQIVRVGVGETIKRTGGMSQACLGKSTSFILDIHNMVNWQLSKQDSHWPVSHDHIAGSCVNSSRWRDLFGSCPLTS